MSREGKCIFNSIFQGLHKWHHCHSVAGLIQTHQSLLKKYHMHEPVIAPKPRSLKIFPVFKIKLPRDGGGRLHTTQLAAPS